MKNFKSAQYKYDNMNDDDRFDDKTVCPVCGSIVEPFMNIAQCILCGWEKDDAE